MPRGGARPGSGRKPKAAVLRALDGGAAHRAPVVATMAPAVAEVEEFDAPDTLTMAARHVWMELAPHAFKARTLNKATMRAFVRLCQNIVIEDGLAVGALAGGADHRGMIQRNDAGLSAFSLRPAGKPLFEAESVVKEQPAAKKAYW